jgi:hypothetical protein
MTARMIDGEIQVAEVALIQLRLCRILMLVTI